MELCILAKVVFLLSLIGISFDIYLYGISFFTTFVNLFITFIAVWFTNWSCYNQTNNWVAWIIVIISFITLLPVFLIIKNQNNNEYAKKFVEEERKKVEKKN
jgi:phosphotransferase system  glucose/maltose/N-acetylglucosamine-specific IIC component